MSGKEGAGRLLYRAAQLGDAREELVKRLRERAWARGGSGAVRFNQRGGEVKVARLYGRVGRWELTSAISWMLVEFWRVRV